jgi:hypothetical protein
MLYFHYKLLNLMSQYLSNIECTGTDLGVHILSHKKSEGFKPVAIQAQKLKSHIPNQSSMQDNFHSH